ncbi:MAG TPA: heat-inducible transcription repressor HrcA [Clostridiaceae bacterium]|nr:heat-inducible transcription repressor HrcA [Clostridiaceae bacterium]
MLLDDRKQRILQAIIDDYISTAEPVGSRTVARKHELGLSSATIRNEMADLEEMGYLSQPHTSAGRIPSDKGYRFYVDKLMKVRELSADETESLRKAMEVRISEVNQLLKQASSVMSRFTNYTSVAVTPQMKKSVIKAIQTLPIDTGKALVVVVTNAGVIRNSIVKISESILPDTLTRIANFLNDKLSNMTIEKVDKSIFNEIERELVIPGKVVKPILDAVTHCIKQIDCPEVYLDGAINIFNHPEFRDISKAKEFLSVLDEKYVLYSIMDSVSNDRLINVLIGAENKVEEIKDCSLVTTTYSLGGMTIGSIGVIGPTRMEYSKVISSMKFIREKLNQEINKLLGDVDED